MQVAMLGPLEVRTGPGEVLEVGGSRLRALLILLALRPGQLVLTSELIDGLWGESAPGGAANALQALVSRLRRALPGAVIESRPAGYQLKLDPQATDIVRFEELAAAGRAQLRADPAAAAATLRQDELRQAHARYFTALAETGQGYLRGAPQLEWLRRLSEDQDNLHAALRGAAGAGDGETAVRLAAALGWYRSMRSMKIEGAELVADALSAVGTPAPPLEPLAEAYIMGGLLAGETPMHATAVEWFERAAELAGRIPDPVHSLAPLIGPLSQLFLASERGLGPAPPEIFDDAIVASDPWVSAIAQVMRGHTALNLGRLHAQAEGDFLAAAQGLEALGDRWGQAVALGGLAMLAGWRGEHSVSVAHYRQAHRFAAELGSTEDQVHFRLFMVRELWLAGQHEAARAELAQALPEAERIGLPEVTAFAAYTAGDLARLEGEPETARAALTRALDLARGPDISRQIHAVAATALGYLAGAQGNLDEARELHAEALATARSAADAPVIAEALAGLADLALREGDPERSAELLGASLGIRGALDRSAIEEQAVAQQARTLLGDARYDAAYQRGQRATLDTLATLAPVTPGA